MKIMKILNILTISTLSACAVHTTAGFQDELEVTSVSELFTPGFTYIKDKKTSKEYIVGGQSIVGQVSGPASAAIFGTFLKDGLSKSGDRNSFNNGNSNQLTNKQGQSTNQQQLQGQLQQQGQTLGGHHNDGLENNIGH